MNFEALKKETPVMFEEELKHVRFYLSIEKLRFRDAMASVYTRYCGDQMDVLKTIMEY